MARIFSSNWMNEPAGWIVAPLALWMVAYLVRAIILSVRAGRLQHMHAHARSLSAPWRWTFVAAVAWLLGWAAWIAFAPPPE